MRASRLVHPLSLIAVMLLLATCLWDRDARADDAIAGVYDAQGVNPGGKRYAGVVGIVKEGQTYRVVWQIGTQNIQGIGVATATSLAVAFNGGVVLYERASEDTWCGIWASGKGRILGREMLTRQKPEGAKTANCNLVQAMLSTSSSERLPGTMVTGTRSLPTNLLVSAETSGPGPRAPVAAPSTSIEIVGSSSISFSNSSRRAPSRT